MDVYRLIAAVREQSPIWDKSHHLHTDRAATDKCWKDIAEEINSDEVLARKKWKYLREKFCLEYNKWAMNKQSSGKDWYPPSSWHYFQDLMFLKKIVTPKPSVLYDKSIMSVIPIETDQSDEDLSNLQTAQLQMSDQEDSSHLSDQKLETFQEAGEQEWQHVEELDDPLTQPVQRPTKRKRSQKNFYNKRQLNAEENNMPCMYNYNNSYTPHRISGHEDTDLMFFKTLLPHVALIPLHKKLEFHSQVQAVVQKYACYQQSGEDSTCSAPNSTALNPSTSSHPSSCSAVSQSYSPQTVKQSPGE